MIGAYSGVIILGFHTGWTTGFRAPFVIAIELAHAVYERRHPESDPAIGLGIDIAIGMFLAWMSAVPVLIAAIGLMFVVFAAYFQHGIPRLWLLGETAVFIVVALTVTGPDIGIGPNLAIVLSAIATLGGGVVIAAVLMMSTRDLRRAELERGYVMGTVAHELRNDLTPVVGLAMVLADETSAIGRSDLAEIASTIASQGMDATDTVQDLLTVARLERESLGLNIESVDLSSEVDRVVRRTTPASIEVDYSEAHVMADPVRVRQIIRNLSTNAVKYGGDEVRIEIAATESDRCHVIVRDNGRGIPPDEINVVFEPFGRGQLGRGNTESVGLGLWIARQLARAMGGELSYRREPGWTVFDLSLPFTAEPGPDHIHQPSPATAAP
jgi:signal transduction histidine kinase